MAAPNTYSTVVSWAKIILPLVALGLLSTLFLFSRTPDPNRAIPFAAVDVEELAREQRLGNPRFAGTLPDGREVIFTAERAAPVAGDPNLIEADGVEARIDLTERIILLVVAGGGLFDLRAQIADLAQTVQLTTSDGYQLSTEELHFELRASTVDAPGNVALTGPGVELTAGRMQISSVDGNDVVVFNDGVRVLYAPRD